MRVLLITHRYPPDGVGGVERYVESLAGELAAVGDNVSVLTRTPRHFPRRPVLRRDVGDQPSVHRIVGSGVRLRDPFARSRRLEALVREVLDREQPEVVHINHMLGLSPGTIPLVQSFGIPLVLSLHDYYFACPRVHLQKVSGEMCQGPKGGSECARTCFVGQPHAEERWATRAALYSSLLRSVEIVLCPPGSVAQYFAEYEPNTRLRAIPLGIDAQRLAAEPAASPLRVVILGSVAPHKGAHVVLEALEAVETDVSLVLAGRVEDTKYLNALQKRSAEVSHLTVESTGPYVRSELPALLDGAHVAVFPSVVNEAYPLAAREARACGVPVFVSDVRGLDEVVREGGAAPFAPGDAAGLVVLFRRLVNDVEFGAALRREARAAHTPTAAEHARLIRDSYLEALAASRAKVGEHGSVATAPVRDSHTTS